MSDKYILDGHKAVPASSLLEWGRWFETGNRIVAQDNLPGGVRVSTVFLALDHSFGEGPPLLFETMIFGGPHSEDQWRYTTWEEAEAGHAEALKLAQEAE